MALKKRERAAYTGEKPANRTRRKTTLLLHLGGGAGLLVVVVFVVVVVVFFFLLPVQTLLLLLRPNRTTMPVLKLISTRRTCEEHTYNIAKDFDASPHRTYKKGQEIVGIGGGGGTKTGFPGGLGGSRGGGGGRNTRQGARNRGACVPQLQGQLIGGSTDLVLVDVALSGCLGQGDQLSNRLLQTAGHRHAGVALSSAILTFFMALADHTSKTAEGIPSETAGATLAKRIFAACAALCHP
jgi:hypothetical protein